MTCADSGWLPPGDPGRRVLVIGGGTNALTQLPAADPREHVLKVRGEVDCTGPMDALPVKLSATALGYPDYELRATARETKEHASTLPLLAAKLHPVAGPSRWRAKAQLRWLRSTRTSPGRRRGHASACFSRQAAAGCCGRRFGCPKSGIWRCHHRKAGL